MMPSNSFFKTNVVKAAARASNLSIAQLKEVESLICKVHPGLSFSPVFLQTIGDLDKKTSLRGLEKTDFFTKELDDYLLNGQCQIAIHSAKDLPDPLPKGIVCVALTKSIDSRDSLVFREKLYPNNLKNWFWRRRNSNSSGCLGISFETLPFQAKIGTSSFRRIDNLKRLRKDLVAIDIRGTIEERLKKLQKGELDGIIVAEAALIRLNLTHLPRIFIPGDVSHLQGRLAVLARENDLEMAKLFSSINVLESEMA